MQGILFIALIIIWSMLIMAMDHKERKSNDH